MKTVKEEIHRTSIGIEDARFLIREIPISKTRHGFIQLKFCLLNKAELQDLINWLISKLDEME